MIEYKEYKYRTLKTYDILKNNHFNYSDDLDIFLRYVEGRYNELINSNIRLKDILKNAHRLEKEILYVAETNFKNKIKMEFTFVENLLHTIFLIYTKELDNRLFKVYKNKKNKEFYYYNVILKDISIENISSLEVIELCKEHFKLDFGNLGTAGFFINDIVKESDKLKLKRLQ